MTLEKALDAYRNHFGEDYPLVITGTASEDEIIDEIERCIETNEKAEIWMDSFISCCKKQTV